MANDGIDLTIEPGQIHALLGENGAGKSTLMNVLYGLLQPDEGEIVVDGTARRFGGPGDAIAAGIGMVHQHFMLVPVFTVAENVMLGREPTRGPGFLDRAEARREVSEVAARYGLAVDPDARVADLPVGVQQRVEIIKALLRNADVLILDEPTAVLTPQETEDLFQVMRSLKAAGRSVVFITHKLGEVRAVADTITVIRRGKVVGSAEPSAPQAELAALMVGRAVELTVPKKPANPAGPVLDVRELTAADPDGLPLLAGVDFEIRSGEILAVAGVQGNGQTELVEALMGLRPVVSGSVRLDGRELVGRTPRQILDAGVGYIPEDRRHDGLISQFTIAENLILDSYAQPEFASGLSLRLDAIRQAAIDRIAEFDVRTPSRNATAGTLSGGNQQKVVLAREMSRPLRLLVASQPTRGLDVGSIEFVHRRMVAQRDRGAAVLIVSSELDEVYALADRIAVMYRGRVVGVLPPTASREEVGLLMAGGSLDGGRPADPAAAGSEGGAR